MLKEINKIHKNLKYEKKKALTLLEVVISISIISLLIVPVLTMFFQSSKANKNSEDKQKAIYVAQKYTEKAKMDREIFIDNKTGMYKTEFTNKQDKEIPKNFKVEKTIKEEEEYKFKSSNNKKKIKDIMYDGKLKIKRVQNENKMEFYNSYSTVSLDSVNIKNNNIVEIVNEKHKIKVNLTDNKFKSLKTPIIIEKNSDNSKEKASNLIIYFENDTKCNLKVKAENKEEEELRLYFLQKPDFSSNYTVENKLGKVKTYNNIMVNNKKYKNNTRLYKVRVKVFDIDQNKVLEDIISYINVEE
ncbi:hypothetical protein FDF74_04915 [Clostridium niameyense]|uniref:Prepilin-type N-terminal cleavage/methylation domain-containing protein n=1 Tax=Clostridium niameyense TaxID=1622073 RepID=A0A6M0R8L0_9CLOT|nr:hypothetical protein [Clostridium niameyense]NEZ46556.1 hypothetical protein [Clostridium niameyense]